jgi:hypothetical protein
MLMIDETAVVNELTVHRRYGWAPKGKPATHVTPLKRTQKWSVLPLYTYDGFTDWMMVQGSFNGDLFVEVLA